MDSDILIRLRIDPGRRTLGELLQGRVLLRLWDVCQMVALSVDDLQAAFRGPISRADTARRTDRSMVGGGACGVVADAI